VLRTFVDSTGTEWEVFDVVPRDTERRTTDRRSRPNAKPGRDVERRERERRLSVGGRSRLTGQGWLAFQNGDDRRRLSPIPLDWQRASDAELEAYCLKARPVRANVAGDAEAARRRR
jgi:hypothetical protein